MQTLVIVNTLRVEKGTPDLPQRYYHKKILRKVLELTIRSFQAVLLSSFACLNSIELTFYANQARDAFIQYGARYTALVAQLSAHQCEYLVAHHTTIMAVLNAIVVRYDKKG